MKDSDNKKIIFLGCSNDKTISKVVEDMKCKEHSTKIPDEFISSLAELLKKPELDPKEYTLMEIPVNEKIKESRRERRKRERELRKLNKK